MEKLETHDLTSISPIDGRYRKKTRELSPYLSEFGLIKERVKVEIEYLKKLAELKEVDLKPKNADFGDIYENFTPSEARIVKRIEKEGYKDIPATNHDVKAVEYYLRDRLAERGLKNYIPYVHFGLTSEDATNLALGRTVKLAVEEVLLPRIRDLAEKLISLARENADIPMLARTHGQPATPTTVGKEFSVYAVRVSKRMKKIYKSKQELTGKLCGASGNFNAHDIAFPEVDWIKFSTELVENLGLQPNLFVTQIEPRDQLGELLTGFSRLNNPLIDLAKDCWLYISQKYFDQKNVSSEVGSSTMPHKLNPIDFENCEGNLNKSISDLGFISGYMTESRLQRDLSDSTVMRNIGSGLAHSLIGYKSLKKGLNKLEPNREEIGKDLSEHHEVITEAWQTILRKKGHEDAYEMVKELSKGKKMTEELGRKAVEEMPIEEEEKELLRELGPEDYLGEARRLSRTAAKKAEKILSEIPVREEGE